MENTKELTATDHINKKMLSIFKNHIESGKIPTIQQQQEEEKDNGEWDSEIGSYYCRMC